MKQYTVSARLNDMFEVVQIDAVDETEATITAIHTIMTKAYHEGNPTPLQRLWTRGEVTFRNAEGDILHHMDSKEEVGA